MRASKLTAAMLAMVTITSACGLRSGGGSSNNDAPQGVAATTEPAQDEAVRGENILSLFRPPPAENVVNVNRYIWNASLQVLDFLPIQSIDPFTGVIVTGYGTPPGGGRAYRATILVDDPALEARSLNVALQSRSGPVSAATQRAVEDAILTRARQLRVEDSRL